MKRFMIFAYSSYYPSGGLEDVINSFDTLEEALRSPVPKGEDYSYIWDRIDDVEYDSRRDGDHYVWNA